MGASKFLLAAALALVGPFASSGPLTLVAAPALARTHDCGTGYYRNTRGHCVHRPTSSNTVPQGATAQCRDGSYSFSENHRGTCSHHGGVARWL